MELVASLSFKFNGHSIGSYLNSKLTSISNLINDRVDLSILKLYKFDKIQRDSNQLSVEADDFDELLDSLALKQKTKLVI